MEKTRQNIKPIFLVVLTALAVIIWYAVFYFESRQNLLVTFLDVGQGDAIFIEIPNGNQILIDGGPDDSVLAKLGSRMPFWDRSIDLVILTHPEKDHVAGLVEILRRYDVDRVLWTGVAHSIAEFYEWERLLKEKNISAIYAYAGQHARLGQGAFLDVLSPSGDFVGKSVKELNETSVVVKFEHGENSFLFTGDIGRSTEYRMLSESLNTRYFILDTDVLKVAHHGSKYSSMEPFLAAVSPNIAIAQVGRKNRYGHPARETLDRLAAVGAAIFRNDTDGDITIVSDGLNFWKK